jgi:arylsulfatase A-like enzyme
MQRRNFLKLAGTGVLAATLFPKFGKAAGARKPNILLIVSDDQGYGDMGCYGCKDIPTPNMDAIAQKGVRFTAGYVGSPLCSPSRATMLTGRYPTRVLDYGGNPPPGSDSGLPIEHKTMANYMQDAGYRTAAFGKWHLGETPALEPRARGFDYHFGFLGGMHDYFKTEDKQWGLVVRGRERVEVTKYLTFMLADDASAFIRKDLQQPFFMYLAFNAPHTPKQAPEDYLAKAGQTITDPTRRVYAAQIMALDDAVGQVMTALRESGQEENTVVVYVSDNGAALIKGSAESGGSNGPLRGSKVQLWEGGIRVPFMLQWPGHVAAGRVADDPVHTVDLLPTLVAIAGGAATAGDGMNLLPWLEGKTATLPERTLFWKIGNQMAVRRGDLKMVRVEKEICLFNVRSDIGETKNLATEQPALVKELEVAWNQWDAGNMKLKPAVPRKKKKGK